MKLIVRSAGVLALSIFVFGLGAGPAAATGSPGISGTALMVKLNEWSLGFTRIKAAKGNLGVEVTSIGRYPHNFVVQKKLTGEIVYQSPVLRKNQMTKTNLNLPTGQYELYCSLPGHRSRGMLAALTVGG